ncbi:MAG: hypothetical protein OQK12_07430 [Motiliproteus sp.]|nr:hypothetical protein [Motiliproteus sp.]MCW9053845.1 hypothetical protein [Motiliproteus sp.]
MEQEQSPDQLKKAAFQLYRRGTLSLADISQQLGISTRALRDALKRAINEDNNTATLPPYPEVERMRRAVVDFQLSFESTTDDDLEPVLYRRLQVNCGRGQFVIPVADESDDIEVGNPVVMLHLVLDTLADYDESDDFLVWCKDLGLPPAELAAQRVWDEIGEVAPVLSDLFKGLEPVGSWEMEFCTGPAQALRASRLKPLD